ncbi:MAG: ABC transporter permease [Candidatus Rokubacteria bacterium]|nr:ABC transporter permease [Candidatus Rokubacteria bacterium]
MTTAEVTPVAHPGGRGARLRRLGRLARDPVGLLGTVLVAVVVAGALFADVLTSANPTALDLRARHQWPSPAHPLGTDHLGRDLFARVLHGGRVALQVSLVSVSLALSIGLVLGMLAGYGPRGLDNALLLAFDAVRSFPTTMFALAVVTLLGPSLDTIVLVVVVTSVPVYGRIVRTQTLSLKTNEFILAERALGAGVARVLAEHVLPNVVGPVLILASMEIPVVVTIEAGLSFLGLGIRPPTPSWGSILNDGYTFIRDTPWVVIAGGLPLVVTTLGFTFLGESLRDIFDPRLRRD